MFEEGDKALWNAVIVQALKDALYIPSGNTSQDRRNRMAYRESARNWLLNDSRDFRQVCEFAGKCPMQVRRFAERKINEADAQPMEIAA